MVAGSSEAAQKAVRVRRGRAVAKAWPTKWAWFRAREAQNTLGYRGYRRNKSLGGVAKARGG